MEIYAKLAQVKDLAKRLLSKSTLLETRIKALESSGFQQNAIEQIKMNGTALPVVDKAVNLTVPTTTAQLTNDAGFIQKADARTVAQEEIAKSGYLRYKVVPELPSAEEADEHIWYLLYNGDTGHFDIYALMAGEMCWLDDTTVDLSGYVEKEEGKGLSSEDFTAEEKAKLQAIEANANNYQLTKQKVVDALGYTPGDADNPQSVDWANVTGKPETFTPSAHNHDDRYYTEWEMNTKLGNKVDNTTDGASTLINKLGYGTAVPVDSDYVLSQYVGGGTTNLEWVRRPISSFWAYFKSKADIVYQAKGSYAAASHTHNYAGSSSAGGDANCAVCVKDYNNPANNIYIGWSGDSLTVDNIGYIAGYTNDKHIKEVPKATLRQWLGLGGAAYSATSAFAAASHSHTAVNGVTPEWDGSVNLSTSSWLTAWSSDGKKLKAMSTGVFATANHSHAWSAITGKPSIVGSVSYSNGVLSVSHTDGGGATSTTIGGIAASGTNYVRFTDGTQICWNVSTAATSISGHYRGTWPQPFANTSYYIFNEFTKTDKAFAPSEKGTTYADMTCWWARMAAIGRWK